MVYNLDLNLQICQNIEGGFAGCSNHHAESILMEDETGRSLETDPVRASPLSPRQGEAAIMTEQVLDSPTPPVCICSPNPS